MNNAVLMRKEIPVQTHRVLNILHPRLAEQMQDYRMRLSVFNAGYSVLTDWHPVIREGWGEFPHLPMQRSVVYRGDANSWAYSHHVSIAKFGNRYVVSWSNGFLHEDYVGQEVHCAWSEDGIRWSEPRPIMHTPAESGLVRNNAGLCAANGRLYCTMCVASDFGRDAAPPGMCSFREPQIRMDVSVTTDMEHWEHYESICDDVYLFEGPRPTREGKFLCCGFDMKNGHAMVLLWDNASLLAGPPRVVRILPAAEGVLPEQGTWYQTDDGRIWMYQRDITKSCRMGLTWSDDGGETWSELLRTDFPNSYSRAFAGRLTDGRCYIVGNNYDIFLDRRHLLLALSDNGYVFDRQYTLVEGNTTRRINGRHKEDGYHYPNCIVDGDRLLVAYSVNKEDIEVGVVDMRATG